MTDDGARAQRKALELLQARLKEAQQDLEVAHSDGFLETLKDLSEEARAAEQEARAREDEVSLNAARLVRLQHDVAEAERNQLAPRAVFTVSPALGALTLLGMLGSIVLMTNMLTDGPSQGGYLVLGALTVLPPPVLAWVMKRRFSGAWSSKP